MARGSRLRLRAGQRPRRGPGDRRGRRGGRGARLEPDSRLERAAPGGGAAVARRDLPVIVVRGAGEPRRSCLRGRAGAVEEIPAPLTRGAVMHAIVRALEWRDASAERAPDYLDLERSIAARRRWCATRASPSRARRRASPPALVRFLDRKRGRRRRRTRSAWRAVARELGLAIGMSRRRVDAGGQAAALHDLGQALLPQALRQAPAGARTVSSACWRGRHPDIVFDLLSHVPGSARTRPPWCCARTSASTAAAFRAGSSGLEIPMGARVIALAGAIDAWRRAAAPARCPPPRSARSSCAAPAPSSIPISSRVWLRLAETAPSARLHWSQATGYRLRAHGRATGCGCSPASPRFRPAASFCGAHALTPSSRGRFSSIAKGVARACARAVWGETSMMLIVGVLIVLGSVAGGYLMHGGNLLALNQPSEFLIIGGAAIGSLLISTPIAVREAAARQLRHVLQVGPGQGRLSRSAGDAVSDVPADAAVRRDGARGALRRSRRQPDHVAVSEVPRQPSRGRLPHRLDRV